jgi:hypothetical protein
MKIRLGFVSNSSTSSFCIYGITLSKEEFLEKLADKSLRDLCEEDYDLDKIFSLSHLDLIFHTMPEGEEYIGKDMSSIKDEETFGEFKNKIKESLKLLFNKDCQEMIEKECRIHEESWTDC